MAKLEELKELVQVINRNKVKHIQVIGNSNSHTTIIDKFYDALVKNEFENDIQYQEFLYGHPGTNQAYYKLRDRLYEKTINTVFFIDKKVNLFPSADAYYQSYKDMIAIKFLLGKSARRTAIKLASKTLKTARYYTFTDIEIELTRIMRFHYGEHESNISKFNHYNEMLTGLQLRYCAEIEAEGYYQKIRMHYINSHSLKQDLLPTFKRYHTKVFELKKKYTSYKIFSNAYVISLMYYEIDNNWNKILKICEKAVAELNAHPQFACNFLNINIMIKKLEALLFLKKFDIGEKYSAEILESLPSNFKNRFYIYHLSFILLLHSRQYYKAKDIHLEALINNVKHYNHIKTFVETLRIHEAFIHYLIRIGKIKEEPDDKKLKPFRLGKFLNEVPIYSKDKRGSNITILILQILFLLEDKKHDIIIDRAESLKSYNHRYLKEDETYRSNCFIRMLLCLPAAGFQKDKVEKKARKHLEHLRKIPLGEAKQSPEVEVMPYEMLWEFVLESLDK